MAYSGSKVVAHALTFHPSDLKQSQDAWDWRVTIPKVRGLDMDGTEATEAGAKASIQGVWEAWLEMLDLMERPTQPELAHDADSLIASSVSAEREACAALVEPKGPRPCDCTSCYCGNLGDHRDVTDWDTATALAASIRGRNRS